MTSLRRHVPKNAVDNEEIKPLTGSGHVSGVSTSSVGSGSHLHGHHRVIAPGLSVGVGGGPGGGGGGISLGGQSTPSIGAHHATASVTGMMGVAHHHVSNFIGGGYFYPGSSGSGGSGGVGSSGAAASSIWYSMRDKTDAAAKRAFRVQVPTRLVFTTMAVFLLLPLTLFLYKEIHMRHTAVPDIEHHAHVAHHFRRHNEFPAWMEEENKNANPVVAAVGTGNTTTTTVANATSASNVDAGSAGGDITTTIKSKTETKDTAADADAINTDADSDTADRPGDLDTDKEQIADKVVDQDESSVMKKIGGILAVGVGGGSADQNNVVKLSTIEDRGNTDTGTTSKSKDDMNNKDDDTNNNIDDDTTTDADGDGDNKDEHDENNNVAGGSNDNLEKDLINNGIEEDAINIAGPGRREFLRYIR